MNQAQMLNKMILPMEYAFIDIPFYACRIMVGFNMKIVRRSFTAKDAAKLYDILLRCTRPMKSTYPLLERQMQGFLVTSPIMLGLENLGTEGALIWHRGVYDGLDIDSPTSASTLLASFPTQIE
jgi:hypothetical protein